MNKKPSKNEDENEHFLPLAPNEHEPDAGQYKVAYQRYRMVKRYEDRYTMELHFIVIEPVAWKDTSLIMYCPIPLNGVPGKRSKYTTMWMLANGGTPAPRRSRMSPNIFQGYWLAEVGHTRQRMVKGGGKLKGGVQKLSPGETGLAVIDHLIERVAGGVQS